MEHNKQSLDELTELGRQLFEQQMMLQKLQKDLVILVSTTKDSHYIPTGKRVGHRDRTMSVDLGSHLFPSLPPGNEILDEAVDEAIYGTGSGSSSIGSSDYYEPPYSIPPRTNTAGAVPNMTRFSSFVRNSISFGRSPLNPAKNIKSDDMEKNSTEGSTHSLPTVDPFKRPIQKSESTTVSGGVKASAMLTIPEVNKYHNYHSIPIISNPAPTHAPVPAPENNSPIANAPNQTPDIGRRKSMYQQKDSIKQRPSFSNVTMEFYVETLICIPFYNDFSARFTKKDRINLLHKKTKIGDLSFRIHPASLFRISWDLLIWCFLMAMVAVLPLAASFEKFDIEPHLLDVCFSVPFLVDIFFNFYTTKIIEDGEISVKLSRKIYLKGSFILDLISVIPLEYIVEYAVPTFEYPEVLLLVKLVRLHSFSKIVNCNPLFGEISKIFQKVIGVGSSFMSIFLFGGLLVVYLHLHACSIFLVGKLEHFSTKSWHDLHHVVEKDLSGQYTWSIFSAISNTFPVTGYRPTEPVEQWVTIIAVLLGALLYAALVGTISSFSFGLDSSGRLYKQKMDEVNEYMMYKKLSNDLKEKVRSYYELKYRGKLFDEESIMLELNDSLRQEIAIHNCKDLIGKVKFLNRNQQDGRDEIFMGRIANALRQMHFIAGDTIFEQGRVGNEMYFILSGCVEIIVNGNIVGALEDGAFFGEVALLGQVPRTATIRAKMHATLYSFERSDFHAILANYEDMAIRIQQVYQERMLRIVKEKEEKVLTTQPPLPLNQN